MKKIISAILCFALLLSQVGCASEKEDYKNVSRIENCYYIGESESFTVILTAGKAETPQIIDGSAGKLESYAKLKLEVKSGYGADYKYQVAIGEEGFSGDFCEEIVGGNFIAEFKVSELCETSYKVIVTNGEKSEEVVLESVVTSEMIKWNEAKAIASKELSKQISEMQSEISDNYEVYVKFVFDRENKAGSWYVAFISEEKLCAVLISPTSGKVTAKRI